MGRSFDIAEFSARDGIDPAVAAKLNRNFKRLASESSVTRTDKEMASAVFGEVARRLLDTMMPIGTILVVDNMSSVPGFGAWEVCDEMVGRYVKAGTAHGQGGRQSFTIAEGNLPAHSHKYDKATAPSTTRKFKEDATGASALDGLTYVQADTTGRGSASPEAISLDPAYTSVIFIRRTA